MKCFKFVAILFIVIATTMSVQSQTLIEPTRSSYPVLQNDSGDVIIATYTPVRDSAGILFMYATTKGKNYLYTSTDHGFNWSIGQLVTTNTTRFALESITKVGNQWFLAFHYSYQYPYYSFNTAISTDGHYFTSLDTTLFLAGEDISILYNTDNQLFYCYIRPVSSSTHRRTALITSSDFRTWSTASIVFEIDTADYNNPLSIDYRDQVYSMTVVKRGSDWWGFPSILHNNDDEDDAEQEPPYSLNDQTVDLQLLHSSDGVNWRRCGNGQPFITRDDSIKQCYGLPTIIGDSLYIYAFESKRRHTIYDFSKRDSTKFYFKVWRYTLSIDELNKWRPAVTLSLTLGIQGFYNPSTNSLNMMDTVTVSLRQVVAPFSIYKQVTGVVNTNLSGHFNLGSVQPDTYYVSVEHRNTVESWSNPFSIGSVDTLFYDFTTVANKTYGSNSTLKGSKYCFYSGDVNQDGLVDFNDVSQINSDVLNFVEGYVPSDVTGDGVVDSDDLLITYNNANNFVERINPIP